jgi:hypothetical protein
VVLALPPRVVIYLSGRKDESDDVIPRTAGLDRMEERMKDLV